MSQNASDAVKSENPLTQEAFHSLTRNTLIDVANPVSKVPSTASSNLQAELIAASNTVYFEDTRNGLSPLSRIGDPRSINQATQSLRK